MGRDAAAKASIPWVYAHGHEQGVGQTIGGGCGAWLLPLLWATATAAASPGGAPGSPGPLPQRYPAPAWIAARLPPLPDRPGPYFLLSYQTEHRRLLWHGQPWLDLADHLPSASLLRAEPVGQEAVLTVYVGPRRPYAVYRYRAGQPLQPLVESRVGAAVSGGRSLLFVRGTEVLERDLEGGKERLRQRFAAKDSVERIDVYGEQAVVLLQHENRSQDVYLLGRSTPLLSDVQLGSVTSEGWVVSQRGRSLIVGSAGTPQPAPASASLPVIDITRPPLSLEVRQASALVAVSPTGELGRRTPWVVNVEGYDPHRALRGEVLPAHRLQVVRASDGSGAAWRESEADPWRRLDGLDTPWGESAIAASQFLLQGQDLLARQGDSLRWFRGPQATVLVRQGAVGMRLAGDTLWRQTTANLWTQTRLATVAAPADSEVQVVQHAGRALRVVAGQGLALDGQPLPYRFPADMRGHFGVVVDGAYPVAGTPYVLLVVGRQSAHGGHFVFDRLLAVDLRDGSVGRLGPVDAWPLGEETHRNFHRLRTIAASPRGVFMRSGQALWLAPLSGGAATLVGTLAVGASVGPHAVSPDAQRIAFVDAGRVVVWDAERAAILASTPVLRQPSWKWGPVGHALAIASAGASYVLGASSALQPIRCPVEAGGSQSPLLDVLPEADAALVCVDGSLAVSRPERCLPLPALSCYQALPVAWGATHL